MTPTSPSEQTKTEPNQGLSDNDQQAFQRLEQTNFLAVILGFIVFATPVLFILASIGSGAPVVNLALIITIIWLILIATSFVFARQAKRRGYLGR